MRTRRRPDVADVLLGDTLTRRLVLSGGQEANVAGEVAALLGDGQATDLGERNLPLAEVPRDGLMRGHGWLLGLVRERKHPGRNGLGAGGDRSWS